MAQLMQRIPEIEAPSEAQGASETVDGEAEPERAEPRSGAPGRHSEARPQERSSGGVGCSAGRWGRRPLHTYDEVQPLEEGEISPVGIAPLPSATLFRAGSSYGSSCKDTDSRAGTPSSASAPPPTSGVRGDFACSNAGASTAHG
jgi:hypothetical protein